MSNKQKSVYLAIFFVLAMLYGFGLAVTIARVNNWRTAKSQEYLSEAKKIDNDSERLLLFEKAAVLNANEETYLNAGITALKLGNNALAEKYLGRVKTGEGYFQLANAYYNLEKYDLAAATYQNALNIKHDAQTYMDLGKTFLKLGNIDSAKTAFQDSQKLQKTKETTNLLSLVTTESTEADPANRAVIFYNALLDLGYPQSAEVVLQKAGTEGFWTRDSLIALAQERIESSDYQGAYGFLLRARTIDSYYPQIYQQLVLVCEKLGKSDEAKQYSAHLLAITI